MKKGQILAEEVINSLLTIIFDMVVMGATKDIGMDATRDNQLGTPEHDRLMMELAKKETYEFIATVNLNLVDADSLNILGKILFDRVKDSLNSADPKFEHASDLEIELKLEVPLYDGKYLIGVLDGLIIVHFVINYSETSSSRKHTQHKHNVYHYLLVEIKPKLTSIGEIIRQINIYRTNLINGDYEIDTLKEPSSLFIGKPTLLTSKLEAKESAEMRNFFNGQHILFFNI